MVTGKGRLFTGPLGLTAGESLNAIFFAFVILEQTYAPNSFFKGGDSQIATHLGRISYGLYLWHEVDPVV